MARSRSEQDERNELQEFPSRLTMPLTNPNYIDPKELLRRIVRIEIEIDELRNSITAVKASLAALEMRLRDIEKRLEGCDVRELRYDVVMMKEAIAALRRNIDSVEGLVWRLKRMFMDYIASRQREEVIKEISRDEPRPKKKLFELIRKLFGG